MIIINNIHGFLYNVTIINHLYNKSNLLDTTKTPAASYEIEIKTNVKKC